MFILTAKNGKDTACLPSLSLPALAARASPAAIGCVGRALASDGRSTLADALPLTGRGLVAVSVAWGSVHVDADRGMDGGLSASRLSWLVLRRASYSNMYTSIYSSSTMLGADDQATVITAYLLQDPIVHSHNTDRTDAWGAWFQMLAVYVSLRLIRTKCCHDE
jgi:hypothetical protein